MSMTAPQRCSSCQPKRAFKMGIRPLARIVGYDCRGCEPEMMGIGPIYAVESAVAKAKSQLGKEIDLVETQRGFRRPVDRLSERTPPGPSIVNVNGGAIAHGPPHRVQRIEDHRDAPARDAEARRGGRPRIALRRRRRASPSSSNGAGIFREEGD
ncbi:MAG: hypothetical protein MZV70_34975 [Desulfobacterales bacterium]|nr:hypothetical protein [Desulfobacterales bacterium]